MRVEDAPSCKGKGAVAPLVPNPTSTCFESLEFKSQAEALERWAMDQTDHVFDPINNDNQSHMAPIIALSANEFGENTDEVHTIA